MYLFRRLIEDADGKPYQIVITVCYGLNILLMPPSRKPRYASNFMTISEAESFAAGLKKAVTAFPDIPSARINVSSSFNFQMSDGGDDHIYISLKSSHNSQKCNARLTLLECEMLIRAIKEKIKAVKDSEVGKCCVCGGVVRIDNTRYALKDGRLIHSICMEPFITSGTPAGDCFPAQKIPPTDCFDFVWKYGDEYTQRYNRRQLL